MPVGIRRMLRRCLERDPRRRLHHIADARIEIEDAADDPEGDGLGAGGGVESPPRARARRRRPQCWRWRWPRRWARGSCARAADAPELRVVEITTPRTSDPWSFALSPDGRRLAFVADHDGQPTLWVRALDAAERTRTAGHGRRAPAILVARQPLDRVLHEQRAEAHRGPRRLGADRDLRSWPGRRPRGDRTEPSSSPAPPHPRCAASMPPEGPWRRRRRQRRNRPATAIRSSCPEAGSSCSSSAVRTPCAACIWARSDRREVTRLVASDTQGAYVAPGWLLFIRQGTLWAQRFDLAQRTIERRADRRRGLRRLRAHRRHRRVLDVGCGRDGLSGGATVGDAALVVRPVRQRARHARIARADRAVESPAVAGWPSRGRRTLAPERDRPVAARFHAPDALHPRVRRDASRAFRSGRRTAAGSRSNRSVRARWRCP